MESEKLSDYPFVHPQRYRSIPGNTDSKYEQNKKLPKWLRNFCTTKMFLITLKNIAHYYYNGLYVYIEFHVVLQGSFFFKLTFGILGSVIN